MRKPTDYKAQRAALEQKARNLEIREATELATLVRSTGAADLDREWLAGLLIAGVRESKVLPNAGEEYRKLGAAHFHRDKRKALEPDADNVTRIGSVPPNAA